ncbi:BaiN/RdsA family NAD(P)/FAD-dependent oxidoreductase [Sabulicella glaciei]|uniref:NAD(P)/FAD-dependent oxidoreductase n=1 Tax=Sabulicella glaciei TaxID=2984948 RepID=A0ABT3NYG8_9PROT|nr:NAD(P)/FAD-dependent oxidoreductase [Roseococcus sp. MDT2-1-1]MCW8087214.1 NAD(P)/FAD-dependent oxidoreductase [Roseococcus sp. MDT2-1-1]
MKPEAFDVVVLGAGAAGLYCAATAGQRGRRVLVLDHAPEPGRKILISGGGRCNFTNLHGADPARYLSGNPRFARSALARCTPQDFLALVERHRIPWHEKTLGQLFCDRSARDILGLLLAECDAGGVDLRCGHRITALDRAERFRVETDRGTFEAPSLVLATGGPSIPKMGATSFAAEAARRFGLGVTPLRPALVPLRFEGPSLDLMQPLSGVSLPVRAACGGARFEEALLFTHRGLSGPAILQVSSFWREGMPLALDLLPGVDARDWLLSLKRSQGRSEARTVLGTRLPARLAAALAEGMGRLADLPDRSLSALAARLSDWQPVPSGTEGYAKAEVTLGGVDTADLSQKDMQARSVPGLFVVGEAVDVTGWLGGYNFQWAWSSGRAAGLAA